MVFDLDGQIRLDARQRGEQVIQHLLGGHPKFPATGGHFQPTRFVAVIALREILGAHQDDVAVIGQVHVNARTERSGGKRRSDCSKTAKEPSA